MIKKLPFISCDRIERLHFLILGMSPEKLFFFVKGKEIGQRQLRNEGQSHTIDPYKKMFTLPLIY